jgi:hypothetical protein
MRTMKTYNEVVLMIKMLEEERNEQVNKNNYPIALSIGSLIHMLKWVIGDDK